jgi:hypothetical protein
VGGAGEVDGGGVVAESLGDQVGGQRAAVVVVAPGVMT